MMIVYIDYGCVHSDITQTIETNISVKLSTAPTTQHMSKIKTEALLKFFDGKFICRQ